MMKYHQVIRILGILIVIFAGIAAVTGIFYCSGPGPFEHVSIRGETITIYGKGLYQHMSRDVAIQGIAHDYVTLFLAIPFLIYSIHINRKGTLISQILLAGILKYFLLTYLFYMNMAMYNAMFIIYILLTGFAFFALVLSILQIDKEKLSLQFGKSGAVKWIGRFLMLLPSVIALLWLEIIITPLIDGTIIPYSTEHYTTLTVQGFDLALFLPIAFLSGLLLLKRNSYGFWMAGVTLVFLCFLLSALVAKIIGMATTGVNVIPVIFIIPVFLLLAFISTLVYLNNLKTNKFNRR